MALSRMRGFPAGVQRRRTRGRFSGDTDILADISHLQKQPSNVGPETALECARRAIWGML